MIDLKDTITKDMLIGDIVKKYPSSINVMLEQGLRCKGCHVATWETLERGAEGHGIDVDHLLQKINLSISKVS